MNNTPLTSIPITADIHLHTSHSHGVATVEEMYIAARQAGLSIIGFSEHSPRPTGYVYPSDYQEHLTATFLQYISSVQSLQKECATSNIQVLLGVEVDYIPACKDFAKSICEAHPYDYCIGGLHFQKNWGFDATPTEWEHYTKEELFSIYEQYYTDLIDMGKTRFFTTAAHPDLIKIFTKPVFDGWLDTTHALPLIEEALITFRDNGMSMEVSSAGLRKPCKEIYPGPSIMECAKKVGVSISFGSDAHCQNTPAFAFSTLAHYAAQYGYTHSTYYVKKEPIQLPFTSFL